MEEQGMGRNGDGVRMGGGTVRGARRRGGLGWLPDVVKRVGTSLGILVRISITGGGESISVEEQARFLLGPITLQA